MAKKSIQIEIDMSLASGEKRAWLFSVGGPLNSDENQLEANKIKCCLMTSEKPDPRVHFFFF